MSEPNDNLARLISRFLDDEASAAETRDLRSQLRHDPHAEALFEETRALDHAAGQAIRVALGRQYLPHRRSAWWERLGRVAAVAAAACLGLALWLNQPANQTSNQPGQAGTIPSSSSWFAPITELSDTVAGDPESFNRPQVRTLESDPEWIVIPTDRRGEFLIVEVDRVKTRVVHIQRDF